MQNPSAHHLYKLKHPETGLPIWVQGIFQPGYPDTRDQPGEPDSVEIEYISEYAPSPATFHDDDISEALPDEQYRAIETAWLEAYYQGHQEEII